MDINAILLDNTKKRKKSSSVTPNKVIVEVLLCQRDTSETINETIVDIDRPITNVGKLVVASNFMSKVCRISGWRITKQCWYRVDSWSSATKKSGWKSNCGRKTSYIRGEYGGDHQPIEKWYTNRRNHTINIQKRKFCSRRQKKKFQSNNHCKLCNWMTKGIYNHKKKNYTTKWT